MNPYKAVFFIGIIGGALGFFAGTYVVDHDLSPKFRAAQAEVEQLKAQRGDLDALKSLGIYWHGAWNQWWCSSEYFAHDPWEMYKDESHPCELVKLRAQMEKENPPLVFAAPKPQPKRAALPPYRPRHGIEPSQGGNNLVIRPSPRWPIVTIDTTPEDRWESVDVESPGGSLKFKQVEVPRAQR